MRTSKVDAFTRCLQEIKGEPLDASNGSTLRIMSFRAGWRNEAQGGVTFPVDPRFAKWIAPFLGAGRLLSSCDYEGKPYSRPAVRSELSAGPHRAL